MTPLSGPTVGRWRIRIGIMTNRLRIRIISAHIWMWTSIGATSLVNTLMEIGLLHLVLKLILTCANMETVSIFFYFTDYFYTLKYNAKNDFLFNMMCLIWIFYSTSWHIKMSRRWLDSLRTELLQSIQWLWWILSKFHRSSWILSITRWWPGNYRKRWRGAKHFEAHSWE